MGPVAKHPSPQRGRFSSTRPDCLLQRHSHPHPSAPTHEALAPHPSPVAPPQGIRLPVPLWSSQFCPLSELSCPDAVMPQAAPHPTLDRGSRRRGWGGVGVGPLQFLHLGCL